MLYKARQKLLSSLCVPVGCRFCRYMRHILSVLLLLYTACNKIGNSSTHANKEDLRKPDVNMGVGNTKETLAWGIREIKYVPMR